MRLPVLRLAAVEIAFLLEMLEKLPLFLCFYPHLRGEIFKVGDQRGMVAGATSILNRLTNSGAVHGLVRAHRSACTH